MTEAEDDVAVYVTGFKITSFNPDLDDSYYDEVACNIASLIGDALASLGTSCIHGTVDIRIASIVGTS